MKSILLLSGGIVQVLVSILHVAIFFGISASELLPAAKISAHIFNAAVLTVVVFFAYVSIFRRDDLISTNLGKILSGFIAVFYLQRGIVEAFLKGISPVNLLLCLVIAAIYSVVFLPDKREVPVAQPVNTD